MPRSRDFDALSEAQVVAGLTAPRRVSPSGLLPSPAPKRITDLLDSIQHVAEAATGERSFLHLKLDRAATAQPKGPSASEMPDAVFLRR